MRLLRWLLLLLILCAAIIEPEAAENARFEYQDRGGLSAQEWHDLNESFYSAWEAKP